MNSVSPIVSRRIRPVAVGIFGLAVAIVLSTLGSMGLTASAWGQAGPGRRDSVLVDSDLMGSPNLHRMRTDLDRPLPVTDCNRNRIDDGLELWGIVARGPVGVRRGPVTIVAAELNGDRRSDLIVVNQLAGNISVLWQRAGRRFEAGPTIGVGTMPTCAAAADLDADGDVDIVVGHAAADSFVTVLWNDGDGAFRREDVAVSTDPSEPAEPRCVALADIDGDGDFDILATTGTGPLQTRLVLIANSGGGRFATPVGRLLGAMNRPIRLAVADFDGDGRPDIAVGDGNVNANNAVFLVANGGAGQAFSNWNVFEYRDAGSPTMDMVVADVDGDGDIDLVLANGGHVAVLLNDATRIAWASRFGPVDRYPLREGLRSLALADLNHDGKPDIVVPDVGHDRLLVLSNVGAGAFVSGGTIPVGSDPAALWGGNLDNDRGAEIVVGHRGTEDVWVLHLGAVPVQRDCNANRVLDACDIASGRSLDIDRNGVPDECRRPHPGAPRRRAP